jgi:hypothetical protein
MTPNDVLSNPEPTQPIYALLLEKARRRGLRRISTSLLQAPDEVNGRVAIVSAQVETDAGVFDAIGAAGPYDLETTDGPNLIHVAETRAKGYALRDAIDDVEAEPTPSRRPQPTSQNHSPNPVPPPDTARAIPPASDYQLATINRRTKLLRIPPDPPGTLNAVESSARITELARQFNDRRVVRPRNPPAHWP